MKKERIMIDGIKYRYVITEENTIKVDGIIAYEPFQKLKEKLINKGKWVPNNTKNQKVKYSEQYLQRRFQKWANIELQLYLEELEDKHKKGIIESEEKLLVQPIREELERRGIKYDK